MSNTNPLNTAINFISHRVRMLSLILGCMALCLSAYIFFLSLKMYIEGASFSDEMKSATSYLVMALAQLPSWFMSQAERSFISKVVGIIVWILLTLFSIVVHMGLR